MKELPFKRIVSFSGGVGSWACAKEVVRLHGKEDVVLLFSDVMMEDEDLYRFLEEASADIGIPITRIADGRTPWQVFEDVRFIGNSRVDPCSRILKRDLMADWREKNCNPLSVTYFGIDWTEAHRFEDAQKRHAPWICSAPLCKPPYKLKSEWLADMVSCGIKPPRLYEMGFSHNNCGGFCVKAGHSHFKHLLKKMPERYAVHEAHEKRLRGLGINGTILRSRKNKTTTPITLETFRKWMEAEPDYKPDDDFAAGCGCALG